MLRRHNSILLRRPALFSPSVTLLQIPGGAGSTGGAAPGKKQMPKMKSLKEGSTEASMFDDIGKRMPFKVTEEMYDRPGRGEILEKHRKTEFEKQKEKNQIRKRGGGGSGDDDEEDKVKEAPKRDYDPLILKRSTASPDHYYPPPPTKKELKLRMQVRQTWIVVAMVLFCALYVMQSVLPQIKRATTMVGRKHGD